MRFLLLLSLASLAACDTLASSDADIAGSYVLVSGAEAAGATVEFRGGGEFEARPVCNDVWGRYAASGGRITLDVTGTTLMHCGDGMGAEIAFNDALRSGGRYTLVGGRLTISGPDIELVFELRAP